MVALADLVLALHVAIILFNIFGLVAIPLGAWRGWRFVRVRWWRAPHLFALIVVAAQAVWGRACFLTLWQAALEGRANEPEPLIRRWVDAAIYWPLPAWAFTALYLAVLAYAVALWFLVRPRA